MPEGVVGGLAVVVVVVSSKWLTGRSSTRQRTGRLEGHQCHQRRFVGRLRAQLREAARRPHRRHRRTHPPEYQHQWWQSRPAGPLRHDRRGERAARRWAAPAGVWRARVCARGPARDARARRAPPSTSCSRAAASRPASSPPGRVHTVAFTIILEYNVLVKSIMYSYRM